MRKCLAATILLAGILFGQSNLATLTGIVTDSSNAAIPNAEVVITNEATGIAIRTQTNHEGIFAAPTLNPGGYQLEVQAKGFKTRQVQNITLNAAQRRRVDVTLEIGNVQEVVEVQAEVTPLMAESAEVSETITAKDIQNIPLNGRIPYSLLLLSPGVSPGADNPSGIDYYAGGSSINGSRQRGNAFVIDGASTTHIGGIAERIGSIEAIQEFKVLSSTYSAEFGRTAGAVITFQVKSGTQNYHGSLYEFNRNSALNATNWENNARGIKQATLIRNEFGGTFGGPMPWTKKKLFFFLSYEGIRDSIPQARIRTIPEPSIRSGNMSGLPVIVRDPLSNAPFPNNIVPSQRIDPAAQKFLDMFPAPNTEGIPNVSFGIRTNNWVRTGGQNDNKNYGTMRWDYYATEKDKLFFTWSHVNEGPRDLVIDFDNDLNTTIGPRFRNILRGTFNYTRMFKPNLNNEFLVSFQRDPRVIEPWFPSFDVTSQLGIQRTVGPSLPTISIAGGYGNYGNSNFQDWVHQPAQASNMVTWLRGRHSLKFGAQLFQNTFWYTAANGISGQYNFNGEVTGLGVQGRNNPINSLADLLLGAVKTASYPIRQIPVNRENWNLGLFINDDWKVSTKLTLNLGLRYEFETKQTIRNNVYSRMDLTSGQLLVAGRNASTNLNLKNDFLNFSPRIGVAYSLNPKTVVRAGLAVFYSNFWLDNGEMVAYPGWTASRSFVDPGVGRAQPFTLQQGFPAEGSTAVPDPLALWGAATAAAPLPVSAVTYSPNDKLPYNVQWNFSVQREVGWSSVVDVGYVASRSVHLARTIPANNPRLDQASRVVIDRVPIQQVRPIPRATGFNAVFYDATADYHSLQLKATRRFANGISLDGNYTFSKNMDTSSQLQDSFQIPWQFANIERARSSLDRPHLFSLGWVYELPFGRRGKFLNGINRGADLVVGGWQFNGTISGMSGRPSTIVQQNTNLVLAGQRPDVVDPKRLDGRETRTVFVGPAVRWLVDPRDSAFPFRPSSNLGIGNLGRNTSRSPNQWIWNLGAFKMIAFTEKIGMQLRVEAYNALNNVSFYGPASTNIDNANYGLITGALPARQIQIGARLAW